MDACAARLLCRYPGWPLHSAAELAIRQADHRAAERHYLEALTLHDDAELPMERTSTLLAYGSMLRQNGQPALARRILAEALDTAEATGAPGPGEVRQRGVVLDRWEATAQNT